MSVGVPIKLFHEAKNHVVTIEMKTGEVYRGHLIDVEDNMNCRLENCQHTSVDGKPAFFDQVYLRGSHMRFVIIPDMFKNAPMFARVKSLAKGRNEHMLRKKARKIRDQILNQIKPQ